MPVGNIQLDARDPLYEVKKTTLQGLSQMSDGVSQKRTEMYNLVLYVIAILITVPLSILIEKGLWTSVVLIGVLLMAFLDYNIWRMSKEKKSYSLIARQLLSHARRLGLNHPTWKRYES